MTTAIDELRRRHTGADPAGLEAALALLEGAPGGRTRGLEALGALPADTALEVLGLGDLPEARRAEARRIALAALAAYRFRPAGRPLSPDAVAALLAGGDVPDRLEAAERAAPLLDAADGANGASRPIALLATGGGVLALGGIFDGPPLLAPGPDEGGEPALLAWVPGARGALVRLDAGGAEVLRELRTGGAVATAWHPQKGLILLGRDGRLADAQGAPIASSKVQLPARIFVAGEAIYLHGPSDPRLMRVEADGKVRVVMEEPASAVAIDARGRVVGLLRGPRRIVHGKKMPVSFRLVRLGAIGPETVAATDGEGEVAVLGDLVFHVAAETGDLVSVDLARGGIRRRGTLAGAEGISSLVATRRALYVTTRRSGQVRAYGPSPYAPGEPAAGPGPKPPAGELAPVAVPSTLAVLAGTRGVLGTGEIVRIADDGSVRSGGGLGFLGGLPRSAAALPAEGGILVIPGDGAPLVHVGPSGGAHPWPFSTIGVVAAARFGPHGLALGTAQGRLVWIDLRRGLLAELARPGLRALAPLGPFDLCAAWDGGLERLTLPGTGEILLAAPPAVRGLAGGVHGAVVANAFGLFAFGPDGRRLAERPLPMNRDPLVSVIGPRTALVVPKGGGEGYRWTY